MVGAIGIAMGLVGATVGAVGAWSARSEPGDIRSPDARGPSVRVRISQSTPFIRSPYARGPGVRLRIFQSTLFVDTDHSTPRCERPGCEGPNLPIYSLIRPPGARGPGVRLRISQATPFINTTTTYNRRRGGCDGGTGRCDSGRGWSLAIIIPTSPAQYP